MFVKTFEILHRRCPTNARGCSWAAYAEPPCAAMGRQRRSFGHATSGCEPKLHKPPARVVGSDPRNRRARLNCACSPHTVMRCEESAGVRSACRTTAGSVSLARARRTSVQAAKRQLAHAAADVLGSAELMRSALQNPLKSW